MFGIGDFARHGRVSVRMLRHYDGIGLLRPAHVDPFSGYRYYDAAQLPELNRIVALKELGFNLQQVATLLSQQVSADELRGMLRLRQAELREQIDADRARLRRVEARLRSIEATNARNSGDRADEVVLRRVEPVYVAELSGIAHDYEPESISPVIQPLYHELIGLLSRAEVPITGPHVAYYEDVPAGIAVHATAPVDRASVLPGQVRGVELPEIPLAAAIIHRGPMDDVVPTGQALARWIDDNGYRSSGYVREVYLECPSWDQSDWVTELQEPVAPAEQEIT